jgi:hypothetical protein
LLNSLKSERYREREEKGWYNERHYIGYCYGGNQNVYGSEVSQVVPAFLSGEGWLETR